jgi:hypothetical protein
MTFAMPPEKGDSSSAAALSASMNSSSGRERIASLTKADAGSLMMMKATGKTQSDSKVYTGTYLKSVPVQLFVHTACVCV